MKVNLWSRTMFKTSRLFLFSGAKVHQSQECTRVIEPAGVSYTLESVGGMDGVTQEMKPYLQHVHTAFQHCTQLERGVSHQERECTGSQFFPLIVCRRPVASRKPPPKRESMLANGLQESERYVSQSPESRTMI